MKAADAKRTIKLDLVDIRKESEADLTAKDVLMVETRRMLESYAQESQLYWRGTRRRFLSKG